METEYDHGRAVYVVCAGGGGDRCYGFGGIIGKCDCFKSVSVVALVITDRVGGRSKGEADRMNLGANWRARIFPKLPLWAGGESRSCSPD